MGEGLEGPGEEGLFLGEKKPEELKMRRRRVLPSSVSHSSSSSGPVCGRLSSSSSTSSSLTMFKSINTQVDYWQAYI
jgi:hypothetical protein